MNPDAKVDLVPGKLYRTIGHILLCDDRPDYTQKFGPKNRLSNEQGPFLLVENELRNVANPCPWDQNRKIEFPWVTLLDNQGLLREGYLQSSDVIVAI